MRRLEAKSICVTGGAQGLGRAMSLAFAREGAAVAVIDLRAAAARSVALEVNRSGGRAIAVVADLSRRHAARQAIDKAAQALGGLDVLVNNAVWAAYLPISETDEKTLDRMIACGLKTAFWCTQAALPHLAASGRGAIINLSSTAGIAGVPYCSAYAMLKAGMDGLTRAWATEFGRFGIRVNSIAPGPIPTPLSKRVLGKAGWESRRRSTPLRRIGTEDELSAAAMFLASDDASFVSGETLRVDGGFAIGIVIPGLDVPQRDRVKPAQRRWKRS